MRVHRGFTLIEILVACVVAALLAAAALPSMRGDALRAARIDAVQALTRLQAAQEQYRNASGGYAGELAALRGVARLSEQGRYLLTLQPTGTEAYRATATARGAQAADTACAVLTLDVNRGFAQAGPGPQCWNR